MYITFPEDNILAHMQSSVFNHLESLEADFEGASLESVANLKKIAPNLKKLKLWSGSSEMAMLEHLEKLEKMKIGGGPNSVWELTGEQSFICPSVKFLKCDRSFVCDSIERLPVMFPNVEVLKFYLWPAQLNIHDSVRMLLAGMKKLKKLILEQVLDDGELETETILQSIVDNRAEFGRVETLCW